MNELLTVRVDFSKKLSVNRIVCVYIYLYRSICQHEIDPIYFLKSCC